MRFALLSVAAAPLAIFLLAAPAAAASSPQSKACSDQATAKGLHGAEREAFRADCMKATGAAAPANKAPADKPAAKAKPKALTASKPTPKAASGAGGATTASKACSDQATAKGLHGADREAFRATCMKGAPPPAAKATATPAAKPVPAVAPKPAATAKPAASDSAGRSPASKACSDQATAKGLHGAEREAFRAECMKGAPGAAKPAASVAKPVAPVAKPVTKSAKPAAEAIPPEPRAGAAKPAAAAGSRSPAQLAADQRIKDCGQQWQTAKAANRIPTGQTWPKYWSACSARMKAAGK